MGTAIDGESLWETGACIRGGRLAEAYVHVATKTGWLAMREIYKFRTDKDSFGELESELQRAPTRGYAKATPGELILMQAFVARAIEAEKSPDTVWVNTSRVEELQKLHKDLQLCRYTVKKTAPAKEM